MAAAHSKNSATQTYDCLANHPQYRTRYGTGNVPQEMKAKGVMPNKPESGTRIDAGAASAENTLNGSVHEDRSQATHGQAANSAGAATVAKPAAPALEWEAIYHTDKDGNEVKDKYAIRSTTGLYTITTTDAKDSYTVFRGKQVRLGAS